MAKSAKKRSARNVTSKRRTRAQKPNHSAGAKAARSGTKQSTAIAMLSSPAGASIDTLAKATGWQRHSVRGFLASVVRKRLGLELSSTLEDGIRVYRVPGKAIGTAIAGRVARKAS